MRAPLSWLRELTPLAARAEDRASVVELAAELDALGLVVERTEWVGEGLGQVVLARVLEIAPIEGADRIRRVVVDRGEAGSVEVVCGAWNFEEGDLVVLAPVGAELPGGFRIEKRKMKGVVSNGMLCSGRELAVSDEHEGILVLAGPGEEPAPLGTPLSQHLGFGLDVVFDLAVEPNRPDCLSMVGVARDLAARYGLALVLPEPVLEEVDPPSSDLASVSIDDPDLCPEFVARVLTGVVPVPSPILIQRRLMLAGMRPINHVVDASNYVMLELGQPNHPYDLAALGGAALRVRAAHPGETVVTLDGATRILGGRPARGGDEFTSLDAVICDGNDLPVGIAGVMGGASSEIGDETTDVMLEVARFSPVAVGRTARHVGLRTEASMRFERGVDAAGLERAAARFCELVVDAATKAGIEPPVVARGAVIARPRPFEPTTVTLRPERANALLGISISSGEMKALLEPIGYWPARDEGAAGEAMALEVPSWRPDVTREVDVIEDVARTYGYRRIPATKRRSPMVGRLDERQALRRRLRRVLAGIGAHEAWTSSIVDPGEQALAGVDAELIRLSNPMAAEESVMRGGLLAGLLKAIRHNSAHRNPWLRLFEVGDVFALGRRENGSASAGADERERVALVLALEDDDAQAAMRAWRTVADGLGIVGIELRQPAVAGELAAAERGTLEIALSGLHPARSGLLVIGGEMVGQVDGASVSPLVEGTVVGAVGEVDPEVLAAFGVPHERVGWLELNVDRLVDAPRRPDLARPVSRYPSSDVDLAFSVAESEPAARVEEVLRLAAGELCESVELFDVYRGPGLEPGRRSLAYRLRLCALDHTLTESELADIRSRCVEAVEAAVPAILRG